MTGVMVVEDEQVIAEDIARSLITLGYEVTGMATTAEECIQGAGLRRPDLVLMDIRLAGELDGVDAARFLREHFEIPVVFLTAYADEETLRRAKLTCPLGYLIKPFRKSELRGAVEVGLFRHRTECQLRSSERRYSATLRAIGDAVMAVDAEGQVSFMNRTAEELLERRESEVRGHPLNAVFQLVDEKTRAPLEDPVELAMMRREVMHLPPNAALKIGDRELPVEDSVAPIVDDGGALLGAVIVMRATSERRETEQQLALANRLSSLGTLAAGVVHEINNPLMYISSNASVVLEELSHIESLMVSSSERDEDAAPLRERVSRARLLLAEVEDGARRIGRIVTDVGLFARKESDAGGGDVVAAMHWALRVSHSTLKYQARVTTDFTPVPCVRGDAVRLGQVFLNLFMNAAHAMSGELREENELFVSADVDADGQVRVIVRDTGSGMAPDVVERIFDPFFTTKSADKGTGLGLAICRRAVREMGGDITVVSERGRGSTFTVRLPPAPFQATGRARSAATRARVLVVDDEPRVRTALGRMLASAHEVVTASNGAEALRRIRAGECFDVLLCDFTLEARGGLALYEQLVSCSRQLSERIVFITGGNPENVPPSLRKHAVLTKPIARGELLRAIAAVLDRLAPRSSPASRTEGLQLPG